MKENSYYFLETNGEKTLAYYYFNPDTKQFGFGFNTADGGGFLPEIDLSKETLVSFASIIPRDYVR